MFILRLIKLEDCFTKMKALCNIECSIYFIWIIIYKLFIPTDEFNSNNYSELMEIVWK